VYPALHDAELVRTWAGLRPRTADGLPALGPPHSRPGTIIATGHFRNGVLLSLATAEAVVNWVLGRPQQIDLTAFRPDRFS
jgi:glycine oxidase